MAILKRVQTKIFHWLFVKDPIVSRDLEIARLMEEAIYHRAEIAELREALIRTLVALEILGDRDYTPPQSYVVERAIKHGLVCGMAALGDPRYV